MTASGGGGSSPATDFSVALLDELGRLGLRHVVLTPGSRSQALALAAADRARRGSLSLTVRIDERVAAFTALGLAVETGMPVAVITTSGTAVGNLLPAVMEASHSGVPLIILSADRPAELRGTGSNQTTWQPGIFGEFVRLELDVPPPEDGAPFGSAAELALRAARAALGSVDAAAPGPVQLNLQFREPLSGDIPEPERAAATEPPELVEGAEGAGAESLRQDQGVESAATPLVLGAGPLTVVIAGHGAGADAEALAFAGGWPLLAEVSSGSRFGPNLVVSYRELLREPDFGGAIERAIVFGHPTLSREVPALLIRDGVETIVVTGGGVPIDPGHAANQVVTAATVGDDAQRLRDSTDARAWLGSWVVTSRRLLDEREVDGPAPDIEASRSPVLKERGAFARAELAALRAPISRSALALAAWRATWPHDRLVLGASRLIREADRVAPGKKIRVHANRGLAGIDGTVSTAIGIALASQDAGPARTAAQAAAHTAEPASGQNGRSTSDPSSSSARMPSAPPVVDRSRDRGGITRVLLGDLTLLHDVGALLIGIGETRPRIQLIVGNDGGGTIFDDLEVALTADPDAFARVMRTPVAVDLAALAAAYGWSYTRVTTRSELDRALTSPDSAQSILEVPLED